MAQAVTVVAALAAVVACGGNDGSTRDEDAAKGEPVPGGTLNMLGSGDVDHMDPNVSYYSIGYLAHRAWTRQPYSYAAVPGEETLAVPDLATDLPEFSDDGLTATWSIRDGVQWNTSPPRDVTAEDAIRGVKITCNPAQPFGGTPDFLDLIVGLADFCAGFADVPPDASSIATYMNTHDVAGLGVGSNDRTVVMTLTRPAAYLAGLMTLTAFSPRPAEYDAYAPGSAELAQHTISDGPYLISSYEPTRQITFARNPAWKGATDPIRKAYVDTILVSQDVSQESTQQQLETGTPSADMEFDNFPPTAALADLVAAGDPQLNLGATAASGFLVFNMRSPNNDGALAQVEVRRAIAHAINRANLQQAFGGAAINPALTHVLPSTVLGSQPVFDLYPFDADLARSILNEAGHAEGLELKLLYTKGFDAMTKAFQVVQQDLSKIGIKVTGIAVPSADLFTEYLTVPDVASRGVWDLAFSGWAADWFGNSALSFFRPLFSGEPSFPPNGSNFGFYDSPITNDLIERAIAAKDDETSSELWHQADEQTMKDVAVYPTTQPFQANYHAEQVHNAVYVPMLQNFDPTNVWLDPAANGG